MTGPAPFRKIKTRFPNLDDSALPLCRLDRDRFEAHIAATHELSIIEAHEEFEDFLEIEALTREVET